MTEKSWHFGQFTPLNWRGALGAACLVMAGEPLAAGQFEVFAARCLDPFEHFTPPIVQGLEPMEAEAGYSAYGLPEGFVLIYETPPAQDLAACTVLGRPARGNVLEFEIWAIDQVAIGRYEEIEAGRWLSTDWIEPKVAVELDVTAEAVAMRVRETDLES
ncbi:hypothetical protein [Pseudaestuariivita atlantica]|uniref:Uncharacterized protein n=1 Tax=Pseudaestuariivita atlantica TaxID=1317121 RepID=A0A0L1JS34_9RHOB|nr:hypothetical protein [Pseudaestuariivita atlantica]KNG94507.1 hypothetical protein ATO11_03550 [Pseudaestuariivita atlantica]